ncbi:MAG: acyltransferase family protein [Variovorax sp.]
MTPPHQSHRRHDIDALRAFAFLLLIVYHLAMYYVAGWPWHLKSPHAAEWLHWPMLAVNIWRMDLVFLVSGVALGFLLRRQAPLRLIGHRALRLLLPLAFGMAVIVCYQAYAEGVANGLVAPGFSAFMRRYLTLGPWPKGAFAGSDFGMTWNHLWYPYLFVYTAFVALLQPVLCSPAGRRAHAVFVGLRGWRLLLLPALAPMLFMLALGPLYPPTHDLINDWYLHALYFTVFLYGYWIGTDEGLWRELARVRGWALGSALACLGIFFAMRLAGADVWLVRVPRALYLWTALAAILGFAHRHLDRPWPWLAWANASVYPWYVLHQTLIIAGAVALAPLRLGPVAEPAILLAATLLSCWLLTDGLIRRVGWLRPLFGLARARIRRAAGRPAAARTQQHSSGSSMFQRFALAAAVAAILPFTAAQAQRPGAPDGPMISGYLCCNMRSYGKQISDINYADEGTTVVAVGTPARITGYERQWFDLDLDGRPQRLKNDYSRDIPPIAFAQRYVVGDDPRLKLAGYPEKTRAAIAAMKVAPGMTRTQVLMALGYPVSSENPSLDAPVWRYWLDTWTEFQVQFDPAGVVKAISGDPAPLARVAMP